MIKILIKGEEGNINYLKISGHANFAEKGKDLVCAGVSAISIGLLNALDYYHKEIDVTINEGLIELNIIDYKDQDTQLILNTVIIQLQTIKENYSNYIRIEKEV